MAISTGSRARLRLTCVGFIRKCERLNMIDPKLEILISRHLDGALSAEEELELNREILRNPAARELLDEHRCINELASAGLNTVLDLGVTRIESLSLAHRPATVLKRSYSRAWWALPAAVAAALGFAVLTNTSSNEFVPRERPVAVITDRPPDDPAVPVRQVSNRPGLVRPAGGPRHIRRDTVHDLLGVVGDDGNVYWLQVDRTRTVDQPDPSSAVRLANGDL